jgi:ATP-dependent Lon protease
MSHAEDPVVFLPVLPLDDAVVLPGMSVTLPITNEEEADAIERAGEGRLVLVPRLDGKFASYGTVAEIDGDMTLPGGMRGVSLNALHRGKLGPAESSPTQGLRVGVWERPDPDEVPQRAHELAREYRAVVEEVAAQRDEGPRVARFLSGITHPGKLADTSGYAPEIPIETKIELLETTDVLERLEKALEAQRNRLADASLRRRIRDDVNDGMESAQREFLLRRQLEAIQKELGEDGGGEDWRTRIAEAAMPEEAQREAERELARLDRNPDGPEASNIRTYLEWMVSLPWNVASEDNLDIEGARQVLDEDHAGLEKVKERVLEYLAVRKLRREREMDDATTGVILTLVGPPGTGKTSLGKSVARALGREFSRMSLGGIRDEAEIRGHRRTYVGALPGRLVRALRDAGTRNPVIMLDEIDKVGTDWRGDPSSALLEVLDPAQNDTFRDHYLDVELDLSEVLFIATANVTDTIPAPLLDRMEVISLDGYTELEKSEIAKGYLIPRQIEANGLREEELQITDDALTRIVRDYTREAGVRSLERELGSVARKTAVKITESADTPIVVDADDLRELLGRKKFHDEAAERTANPGVATGLAVTGVGGDVLFVEASNARGSGKGDEMTLTGQLGDVMRESGRIALTWVRANGGDLGIEESHKDQRAVHLHVPAGAVPKDGPSAGVTMTVALASLFSGRAVRPTVGMTGEVTLQGRVLPVGGIKQKVLAAHRAGLTEVILPERNRGDLDDVPEEVREQLTFHPVLTVGEALDVALEPAASPVAAG